MPDLILLYRDRITRAVLGTRPAIAAKEADDTALARMCAVMVDNEQAKTMMCAKGYGMPSQTLVEMVRALPNCVTRNG